MYSVDTSMSLLVNVTVATSGGAVVASGPGATSVSVAVGLAGFGSSISVGSLVTVASTDGAVSVGIMRIAVNSRVCGGAIVALDVAVKSDATVSSASVAIGESVPVGTAVASLPSGVFLAVGSSVCLATGSALVTSKSTSLAGKLVSVARSFGGVTGWVDGSGMRRTVRSFR